MGLDMYMRKHEYVFPCSEDGDYKNPTKITIVVNKEFDDKPSEQKEFDLKNFATGIDIIVPYAYWRKANAIHKWFIDNFADGRDDCRKIDVKGEDLLDLVEICKQILKDHTKAAELLPTQDGFFFGSTEYDDKYLRELERTVEQLKDVNPKDRFTYQACW